MFSWLHAPKKRFRLHAIICVLMVSWLSLLISNTCMMPASTFAIPADAMPAGCAEKMDSSDGMHVGGDTAMPHQDCSFKPCLDSHPHPAFEVKIDKPQLPVFLLCLIGLIGFLFHYHSSLPHLPRTKTPPIGRRVLLIYRFCTLLN